MKIKTERLTVRPMALTDNRNMCAVLQDFENSPARKFDFPRPVDADKIDFLMRYWVRSRKYYMLDLNETGHTIGFICFEDDEIGFNILTDFQNSGYGYEAVKAFIDYFSNRKNKKIFKAQAAEENIPSVKLLKKLGFEKESEEYINFRTDRQGNSVPCRCGNYRLVI